MVREYPAKTSDTESDTSGSSRASSLSHGKVSADSKSANGKKLPKNTKLNT